MKKTCALFVGCSMLAMAAACYAGNQGGVFSISPVIGGITFEGKQHLETSPVYGLRAGYNFTKALGIEALFDFSKTKSTLSSNTYDFYRYGGELLYHFMPDNKFVPYLAAGISGMNFQGSGINEKIKWNADYGLGAKYFVTDDVAFRGDVRHQMYDYDRLHHAVEYTVGLYIPFGGAAPAAKLADPPPAPPVEKPVVEAPKPMPTTSLAATPAKITKGQQSKLAWTSQNADRCDLQPDIGSVQPQGTMQVSPDADTAYTLVCQGAGGTARSSANVAVVQPPAPVVVQPKPSPAAERFCNKPAVLKINFDVDKYNIKPQYHGELKTVGDFLKEFPNAKGEIAGHTDNTHTRAYNQKLSENRANSVKNYIIEHFGIAPDRIGSKGYSFDKPVATNKTKEGRAKNRRIEAVFSCE